MPSFFGTDGIRGTAGAYPLDPGTVFSLGEALADLLKSEGLEPRILIGRDTRESGPWLEEALASGFSRAKGIWISAGIIPTPAVSMLVRKHGWAAGAVISASHNPFQDNGIKIFSSQGLKISEEWEKNLERRMRSGREHPSAGQSPVDITVDHYLANEYLESLKSRVSFGQRGRKMLLVLDCAHGAAYRLAPLLFQELGLRTEVMACTPNGRNINDGCGTQHPEGLARKVLETKADMGLALDGDADRAVWVDERGRVLNGDHTLYIQARHLKESGQLKGNLVVATVMSNMGLEKALGQRDIKVERTRVGDKYVLERMNERGAVLGGERSGHTIFLDEGPAGDGLLTSLKMLEVMVERGESLSALTEGFVEYPQELRNVRVSRKPDFREVPEVWAVIEEVQAELSGRGRLDVRYSGTEALARIMVEADDPKLVERSVRRVADTLARILGT